MSQVINHTALFKGLVYYLLPFKILQRDSRFNDSINKQINESIDKPNFCFF
jgi:ABC-type spermidine/putrescine transport system permease subunit I